MTSRDSELYGARGAGIKESWRLALQLESRAPKAGSKVLPTGAASEFVVVEFYSASASTSTCGFSPSPNATGV